jgi:hypothetical protein
MEEAESEHWGLVGRWIEYPFKGIKIDPVLNIFNKKAELLETVYIDRYANASQTWKFS